MKCKWLLPLLLSKSRVYVRDSLFLLLGPQDLRTIQYSLVIHRTDVRMRFIVHFDVVDQLLVYRSAGGYIGYASYGGESLNQ